MFDIDLRPLIILAMVGLTLGLWKMAELIIWLAIHISFNF